MLNIPRRHLTYWRVELLARKSKMDYEKTKQRLLEIGLSFFEQKGYNATGLQEIATGAEISKGSFYTYFSSKADFGVGVIRYYTDTSISHWKHMLDDATEEEDAYNALSTTFFRITEKYKEADIKKGCLLGNLAAEISEASEACRIELHESVYRYRAILMKHIALGQSMGSVRDDLPAEQLAELIWDCWQGSLLRMQIEKSVEPVTNDLTLMFKNLLLPR